MSERWGGLFLEALRFDRDPPSEIEARARRALESGVGGFVLFGGSAGEVGKHVARWRSAAGRPLWIAADLERGAGQQFAGGSVSPPPAALAAHPEPLRAVRASAARTAREAGRLGVNWIFAPVLDLDIEPRNPIVGTRSFGRSPDEVARLGRVWIEACQAEGVAACAKHFPGHGRTVGDSHMELPSVTASRDELDQDLTPFCAVAEVVTGVMVGHVAYPGIGVEQPATQSRYLLGELLRTRIGFEGLIVTDALIMEGFHGGAGDRDPETRQGSPYARALGAGCDVLVYPDRLEAAIDELEQAAELDPELAARAETAQRRSAAVLATLEDREPGGSDDEPGDDELARLAADCVVAADGWGPDGWRRDAVTRVIGLSDDEVPGLDLQGPPAGSALREALGRAGWQVRAGDPADAGRGEQRLVVVRATPRGWKGRADLTSQVEARIQREFQTEDRVALVLLGHRRLLDGLGVPGLCAWSAEPAMERAAARWLEARVP